MAAAVDPEVRRLIDVAHDEAREMLYPPRHARRLAEALVENETLEDSDLAEIFGPLDKGAGISVPDPEPTDIPIPRVARAGRCDGGGHSG